MCGIQSIAKRMHGKIDVSRWRPSLCRTTTFTACARAFAQRSSGCPPLLLRMVGKCIRHTFSDWKYRRLAGQSPASDDFPIVLPPIGGTIVRDAGRLFVQFRPVTRSSRDCVIRRTSVVTSIPELRPCLPPCTSLSPTNDRKKNDQPRCGCVRNAPRGLSGLLAVHCVCTTCTRPCLDLYNGPATSCGNHPHPLRCCPCVSASEPAVPLCLLLARVL